MIDERKEIERRIQLAKEFKFNTGGEYLSEEIFPKIEQPRSRFPRHSRNSDTVLMQRITQCDSKKRRAGGIIGVYRDERRGVVRYRSTKPDKRETMHVCAIDAAEAHNEAFRSVHPGVEAFQCDMRAVWSKWGCECGKHGRTE